MKRRLTLLLATALLIGAGGAILHWPAATWLQARASWLPTTQRVDAVYVLSGQHDRERLDGLIAWLAAGGQTDRIFLAIDSSKNRWSSRSQRNLSTGEWTLEALVAALKEIQRDITVEVITTSMLGTDLEVAALARILRARPDVETIALATSRFHIRRTRRRATRHMEHTPGMIPSVAIPYDRSPWVVGVELGKMLRDAVGLNRVPFLGRRWWRRQ
ncbi:MAG: hypothetical protein HN919_18385 [Verrucomicrobia bacterium]|jgi:hypothetical protein|nr:hypothetical protein [Verrucomicrobiota bacterium]MBT7068271.1 hypothetical protein [Verrucomicrobiota bacterium]MBT7702500.1 hypothetical protein [Verrucomicrobiota bacterium]